MSYRGSDLGIGEARKTPWWQRFPKPVERAALGSWSALPPAVRKPLIPLGRLFGPHTVTAAPSPGVDTVDGVETLRARGFEPLEDYTGATEVGELWPPEHRASVPETRPWMLKHKPDAVVWLIRSPWPSLSVPEALNVLWSWAERDHAPMNRKLWLSGVSEALSWDDASAHAWHRERCSSANSDDHGGDDGGTAAAR